jgi:quinol-cytochrome oxidoreductase complex cytochrome b subunit
MESTPNSDNRTVWPSGGTSLPPRERIRKVSKNFFLHFHAAKIHAYSLRPTYTFGLGVIAAFLFLVLIFSGVFLLLYYTPSVERAYAAVKDITFVVSGGRYVRNFHRWAAHGLVLAAFFHLMRVFYTGSYFGSRKVNWIIGIAMLLTVLLMSFSGYLLPWDQLAYWAITIGSNIAASFRDLTDMLGVTENFDIGGFIKKIFIGGETVYQPALTRLFMLHVIFLPVTLLVLTGVHIWRIRKDEGLSRPADADAILLNKANHAGNDVSGEISLGERNSLRLFSWPLLMWAELSILISIVAVLMLLAFWVDAPLREQANPAFPENPAKAPWYFLGVQELVSYSAFAGGVLIPALFITFLILIPFFDKEDQYTGIWFSGNSGKKITRYSLVFGLAMTVLLVFLSINFEWGGGGKTALSPALSLLINPATIAAVVYIAWSASVLIKTSSRRLAAMALFTCAIVGVVIFTVIGIWFRGPNWEFTF